MLDRASLHALARQPEHNDPILNVALAEEGDLVVLQALAECPAVGPEALSRIAARIAAEGEQVGFVADPEVEDPVRRGSRRAEDTEREGDRAAELDARLIAHPRAADDVRDAILARHDGEPFFVLAAAAHPRATQHSIDRIARWPSVTPLHERTWLSLIEPRAVSPLSLAAWVSEDDELAREAAAKLARDPGVLEALAGDPSRRVRRGVAGNPSAATTTIERLRHDPACEVRARIATVDARSVESQHDPRGAEVTSARFKAAATAMQAGGIIASDVVRALRSGPLDEEGARFAAQALDDGVVAELVAARSHTREVELALAAGIAFRRDVGHGGDQSAGLLDQCVRTLADADKTGNLLTGKGRLASWLADGVVHSIEQAEAELIDALGARTLAADRMVLGRVVARASDTASRVATMCRQALGAGNPHVPIALLEIAWRVPLVVDDDVVRLATRIAAVNSSSREQEVDLDPRARPLEVLERIGVALVGKAPLSPRAALALVALEPRRVRYILSALPQWKGVLSGANVARVLKAHAGALSAAGPSAQRRPRQAAASWTQRKLDEAELAVALAVSDLSPSEAVTRLATGYASLTHGHALVAGIEARATLEGPAVVEPLVELLARERSRDGAALAAWLLVEGLDRARSATAIAAALDAPWVAPRAATGPASRSMVPAGLSEALATLERRTPGRLAAAMPQTPRGRAALASGIARAYRALGGMAVVEQERT